MKKKSETRYIVTDVVSIPVTRIGKKGEAYRYATEDGWGAVNMYSAINNYTVPVCPDKDDKTQQLICDEDTSVVIYPKYGYEFCLSPCDTVNKKEVPKQAETEAIIISGPCGFDFWEHETGDVKFFVTYDENGLIDTYRLDNWTAKPYDDEIEISFNDLQSETEHKTINRADIVGTLEHSRKMEGKP